MKKLIENIERNPLSTTVAWYIEESGQEECTETEIDNADLESLFIDLELNEQVVEGFDPFSAFGHTQHIETIEFQDYIADYENLEELCSLFINKPYNLEKLYKVIVEGVDYSDYPKFTDAYISSAKYNGQDLQEEELLFLNNQENVSKFIFNHITQE